MEKLFKIGDIITLNKIEILKWCNKLPNWYSTDEFKIVGYDEDMEDIIILDKDLPNLDKNKSSEPNKILNIFIEKSIKTNRREKLNNIKWK